MDEEGGKGRGEKGKKVEEREGGERDKKRNGEKGKRIEKEGKTEGREGKRKQTRTEKRPK